jgi:radical SAM superfamily enzyme YgiQ (UPF0313 family)
LGQLINLVKDSDLIGISSMAISSHRAKQVANKIKEILPVPVMWGGIYATTCPQECLGYVDMVCVGEGEEAVTELADKISNKEDYLSVKNFWFKDGNRTISNEVRPLNEDLDSLPFADYELDTQYILKGNKILPAKGHFDSNPEQIHLGQILIHTARGCPYGCSYCANRFLNDLYKGKGKVIRKRSFSNVIDELSQLRKKFPLASSIFITDDVFFLRDENELEYFKKEYTSKIGIPFQCYAAPPTIKENKLKKALESGLNCVVMGIQTGSERVNRDIYRRFVPNKVVIQAAQILNKYKKQMHHPTYQFIISNPYEKSNDLIETIKLIQKLPKPFTLEVSHLIFFPGCELNEKAISDRLIDSSQDKKYKIDYYDEKRHLKLEKNNYYLNTLIYCMRGTVLPSVIGSLPASFVGFFAEKKDSEFVRLYWLILLVLWHMRSIYLKILNILPSPLRKATSKILKGILIIFSKIILRCSEKQNGAELNGCN